MFVFNQFEAKPTDLGAFIRAWHRLYVFPRLAPDLAPDDVFPRLAPISCFVHRLLHLAFVSDAASFAFSFIASVKTEPFLLLNCKHNVLEKTSWLVLLSTAIGLFLVVVIALIWICIKKR